mgnify:FL=1|tara:strand:+ start:48 stop:509 length:462 start_codon:yes stop_codon:yes gene_type:complete
MKKAQLKQLIKEEILNILKEDKRPISNKLGLDFKAKKLARKVTSILDRIEQDPKYIESKRLFNSGEMGKRKFEDIIRKELLTPEEHKIFDEIKNESRYGTTDYHIPYFQMPPTPHHKVGRSNVMKRAIDMGLNQWGFGNTNNTNVDIFDEFKF